MRAILAAFAGLALAFGSAAAQDIEPAVFNDVQAQLTTADWDPAGPTG